MVESTSLPKNWRTFLRVDENKTELFGLISQSITKENSPKHIVRTYNGEVASSKIEENIDSLLSPCNHEEADTRIFVHVSSLVLKGHKNIIIATVDTDVVIIAIAKFNQLVSIGLHTLWVEFGVGKNRKWLPINSYAEHIGLDKCHGLPFWYAFSGCDTVSSFAGRGKLRAWETWKVFNEVTPVFKYCPQTMRIIV